MKILLLPNPVGFRLHPGAKGFRESPRKISTMETMKPLTPAASMAVKKTEMGPRARDLNTIRLHQGQAWPRHPSSHRRGTTDLSLLPPNMPPLHTH